MPVPLFIMFLSLVGYAVVARFMVSRPLSRQKRFGLLLFPLVPGLWGIVQVGALIQTQSNSASATPLIKGACLIAAITMVFCAALIAVFTSLLQRSRKREEVMETMAAELRFEEAQLHLLVSSVTGVLWQRCPKTWHYVKLSPQAEGFLGYQD